ncbi:MAG TPA: tetratricopeptide repeat protein, partial [Chthoniobacterales bacterium]
PVKFTLQRASVIGRIFEERVLASLQRDDISKLDVFLKELTRREFVRLKEEGEQTDREYFFKHAITHDVTYSSMLLARRKELHKLVAEALEQLFPDRVEDLSATLGYHYKQAEAHAQAADHLGRAATRARATFANAEAIGFYRDALAEIDRADDGAAGLSKNEAGARLNEDLGDVLTLVGQHDDGRASFDRALSRLRAASATSRSRLLRKIGHTHNWQRHYAEAAHYYDLADDELSAQRDEASTQWWEESFQIQLERMHLLYWQGKAPEMRALASKHQSAIQQHGTPIQRSKFFLMQSLALLTGSRYRPSEECLGLAQRAVEASETSADLSETPHIRFVLGLVNLFRGNFADAIKHSGIALELARRCGDLVVEARCLTYLAVAHRRAGDLEKARTFAEETLELATKIGMTEYVAMAKATLAWVAWKQKRQDDCEKLGNEALELWHEMDDPYSFDWMALWPLIATALEQKQIAHAIKLAEGLFPDSQHPIDEEVMAATKRAIDSWKNGDAPAAESQVREALQTAERHHYI